MPFLYCSSKKYYRMFERYIKNFKKYRNEVENKLSIYQIIKDLYVNMAMLPNYQKQCYFGIRNFKASNFFVVNNTFYWQNFTMSYLNEDKIAKEISKN